MSAYSNNIIEQNTDILLGTVQTHECDPLMDCPECNGTSICQDCHGKGDVQCHTCHGSGDCPDCHGRGRWRCDACGGTGNCRRCHGSGEILCPNCRGTGRFRKSDGEFKQCDKCGGSGYIPCPDCCSGMQKAVKVLDSLTFGAGKTYGKGSGRCSQCGGSGEIVCDTCEGNGKCNTCHGNGRLTCENCNGSGICPNCNNGKVTCKRCQGSGFYQTYMRYNTTLYAKGWKFSGSKEYKDIVGLATGVILHDGVIKTWSDAKTITSDNIDTVNQKCSEALQEQSGLYDEFLSEYAKQDQLMEPNDNHDKPYAKVLKAQRVNVTKIQYVINDKDYELLLIGDNHIAAAKELPTNIQGFELTIWEKIKLLLTENIRLKAYAKLAAYIFLCDGKSPNESKLLEAMIQALQFNPNKEKKFRDQLNTFNSSMPYKQFRKEIRFLFMSRKTITFTWECMAIDKQVSPQEEELFANIVSEYKYLSEAEVTKLKGMATRFARLKPDQIAKEYADLSEERAALRKKIRDFIYGILPTWLH